MIAERQKAAALPTAPKNNQHHKGYHTSPDGSSGKLRENLSEQVTELLFYLANPLLSTEEQEMGWQPFETSLKKYLAVKDLERTV